MQRRKLFYGVLGMRDLTDEELALAPEWATHYCIENTSASIDVCFFNKDEAVNLYHGQVGEPYVNEFGIEDCDRLIPRLKPFDITQHEWLEETTSVERGDHDELVLCVEYWNSEFEADGDTAVHLSKSDAIAIAKHFKLKAEDLK